MKGEFIQYLQYEKRFSDKTVGSYHQDIAQFTAFKQKLGVEQILFVNTIHIWLWIVSLSEKNNHPPPFEDKFQPSALFLNGHKKTEVKNFISTRYDQVCGGGHKPHCSTINRPYSTQSSTPEVYTGIWNVCNKDNPTSGVSTTHKLKEWIEDFADEVFTNSFTPGIGSLIPELASQGCSTDVTNLSSITNITVTPLGGGGYTATTVGGVGAVEYDWSFQGCYINGSGTGGQGGTSTINTISIPAFAASICKLTVTVIAKNGCGGNKTYTKVINYTGSCNNCSAYSKFSSPLNEEMTETVLLLDRQLEINVKTDKNAVLNLYSVDGILLKEDNFLLMSGTNRLDIDKLYQPTIPISGIYLLQVLGDGISNTFRIFITR